MQYTRLGDTGIEVSQLCLGSMTWGEQNSESDAHAQLDCAIEHGVNFIDAAEVYPVPPRPETQGRTESYLGSWLAARGGRDRLVIATKVTGPAPSMYWLREGPRLDARHIQKAVDDSLQRLQTDYIDLYQVHWPARSTNYFGQLGFAPAPEPDATSIEETLAVLADMVAAGKVRHIGVSNETPWGVARYLALSRERKWPRIVSIQNPYNLLNRSFEVGLAEFAHREQVGLLAYSPLAFGVLTGKYLGGAKPEGTRLTLYTRFSRYVNAQAEAATRAYVELAGRYDLSPAQMALAYVCSRPFLTSCIVGASTLEQLQENLQSIDVALSDELQQSIEAVHTRYPNPCP